MGWKPGRDGFRVLKDVACSFSLSLSLSVPLPPSLSSLFYWVDPFLLSWIAYLPRARDDASPWVLHMGTERKKSSFASSITTNLNGWSLGCICLLPAGDSNLTTQRRRRAALTNICMTIPEMGWETWFESHRVSQGSCPMEWSIAISQTMYSTWHPMRSGRERWGAVAGRQNPLRTLLLSTLISFPQSRILTAQDTLDSYFYHQLVIYK